MAALEAGDFDQFLHLVKQSGYSSYMYLQNIIPTGAVAHQDMGVALALCEHYLAGRGAYRVHGGGFAGTVQAFGTPGTGWSPSSPALTMPWGRVPVISCPSVPGVVWKFWRLDI